MVARRRRLGQNFLVDKNLLAAIVRDAELRPENVVLEIGGGEGALTERLAPLVSLVHLVEIDERLRPRLEGVTDEHPNVRIVWGDAMRIDLEALDPPPDAVVANLPYSIATPVLLRTIEELPDIGSWTVMVQREIADRLRAPAGSRLYGSPSVVVQLSCTVELLRTVDREVFSPPPRVDSALLRLDRHGPAAEPDVRWLISAAFAHRRKSLPRSLELAARRSDDGREANPFSDLPPRELRDRARAALAGLGHSPRARAESLQPPEFPTLAEAVRRD